MTCVKVQKDEVNQEKKIKSIVIYYLIVNNK